MSTHNHLSRTAGSFIVLFILALDQVTKWYFRNTLSEGQRIQVTPFLDFTLVYNKGFAFGLLPQGSFIYGIVAAAIIIFIFLFWNKFHGFTKIIMAALAGGAAGNLIDRILFGQVTDWISVQYFSVFNIADIVITLCAIALLAQELFKKDRHHSQKLMKYQNHKTH